MPIVTDITDALTKIDALVPKILRGAEVGLASIAPAVEEAMQTDPVHGDITHAAHDSYFAAPLGGAQDGQSRADHAYAVAVERIADYTKHGLSGLGGHAARVEVPPLGAFERGLMLASPVDYAESLAAEGRSPVLPTLQQFAPAMRQAAADGIKNERR